LIAILGAGFGLYGYLPALAGQCHQQVVLPRRYWPAFSARPELARFSPAISWVDGDEQALDQADMVVIARRPQDQPGLVAACLQRSNIRRLILEKPLAPTPAESDILLNRLRDSGREFRIGYSFLFTEWMGILAERCGAADGKTIEIEWYFLAHYFQFQQNIWKRQYDQGGGPLRFYGIQILAVLAALGYDEVTGSELSAGPGGDIERWTGHFRGKSRAMLKITIDARAEFSKFSISTTGDKKRDTIFENDRPFSTPTGKKEFEGTDPRIFILEKIFRSFDQKLSYDSYRNTQILWSQCEKILKFQQSE
jgi:predicted dehydrogenase